MTTERLVRLKGVEPGIAELSGEAAERLGDLPAVPTSFLVLHREEAASGTAGHPDQPGDDDAVARADRAQVCTGNSYRFYRVTNAPTGVVFSGHVGNVGHVTNPLYHSWGRVVFRWAGVAALAQRCLWGSCSGGPVLLARGVSACDARRGTYACAQRQRTHRVQ